MEEINEIKQNIVPDSDQVYWDKIRTENYKNAFEKQQQQWLKQYEDRLKNEELKQIIYLQRVEQQEKEELVEQQQKNTTPTLEVEKNKIHLILRRTNVVKEKLLCRSVAIDKTSIQQRIDEFINDLSEKKQKAYAIAKSHFGTSFDIKKCNKFMEWEQQQIAAVII